MNIYTAKTDANVLKDRLRTHDNKLNLLSVESYPHFVTLSQLQFYGARCPCALVTINFCIEV